ncbi:hypothetical protein PTTG_30056 [Puccinia triticina 1-1 BBBD Race 1]|uniref:Uncharacterized protein n=1 Tax=Puccinia triticina (isolate 1-1 / race 1 (BBBD)) TaxID=630390 RepID=A0A180G2T5_PUCT1|nr:hypothetical protein PTTG_30056 [Puccinia triticina 1-1 BBBD Race 1]
MFQFALPLNWRAELKKQIRQIDMEPTESFQAYSTSARTPQSLFNFDATAATVLQDVDLAQFVVYGLPEALQHRVAERQLLETTPFVYGAFEQAVKALALPLGQSAFPLNLASQPLDKRYIEVPADFIVPPKPANYVAPRARGPAHLAPGRPTNPPAGRPPARAATVAAVESYTKAQAATMAVVHKAVAEDALNGPADDPYPPALHVSSVEDYEDLDAYLHSIETVDDIVEPSFDPDEVAELIANL